MKYSGIKARVIGNKNELSYEYITEELMFIDFEWTFDQFIGMNVYIKNNNKQYKIFFEDEFQFINIVKSFDLESKKTSEIVDELSIFLLDNFEWEVVSNENQVHIENGKRSD